MPMRSPGHDRKRAFACRSEVFDSGRSNGPALSKETKGFAKILATASV
jgi:hypothetical protein